MELDFTTSGPLSYILRPINHGRFHILPGAEADKVTVVHAETPRFTMTFHPGGHNPLVPVDPIAEAAAPELHRAAISGRTLP